MCISMVHWDSTLGRYLTLPFTQDLTHVQLLCLIRPTHHLGCGLRRNNCISEVDGPSVFDHCAARYSQFSLLRCQFPLADEVLIHRNAQRSEIGHWCCGLILVVVANHSQAALRPHAASASFPYRLGDALRGVYGISFGAVSVSWLLLVEGICSIGIHKITYERKYTEYWELTET